jgi:hypothetical protein
VPSSVRVAAAAAGVCAMAPARDGAGADAAPVVGRAPAVDAREGDRALSFRALLAGSLILLTVFFYEDAMELRMHARRMMFGNRAHEAVLIPGWMRSEAPGVETLAEHEREAATAWGEVEAFEEGEEARASRKLGPRGERAPATPAAPRVDRDETATGSAGRAAKKPTLAPEPPPADVDAMWGTVDDDPYVDDDAPPPKATKTKTTPPPPPTTTTTTTKSDASASASSDTVPKVSLASLAAEAAVNSAADKAKAKAARDAKAAAAASSSTSPSAAPRVDPEETPRPPPPPWPGGSAALEPGGFVPLPDPPETAGGEWRSLGKCAPLANEDVTRSDAALRAAAEKRSFRKEIIVMVANAGGAHLAANAVANLRGMGFEHYLLLGNRRETCEQLRNGPWGIQCGHTSFLENHPRLATYQLEDEEHATPFRLWWARFHVLERLSAFGFNPMYIDTDVSFRANPYPLLKGAFAKYSLIGQDETGHINGVNIGFVYAQNANVGRGAHWVLNETMARMFAILEHEPGPVKRWDGKVAAGAKEHLWDQHIYNDVLESAFFGREMRRRSGQRLVEENDGARRTWEKETMGYPMDEKSMSWDTAQVELRAEEVPRTATGAAMKLPPDARGRGSIVAREKPLVCYGATPQNASGSSTPEYFLAAPPWFIGGWSGVAGDEGLQGVLGNWNLDPPPVAVAHFVGALQKQSTMKQLGWWAYGAEVYRAKRPLEALERDVFGDRALAVRGLAAVDPERSLKTSSEAVAAYGAAVAALVELAVAAGRRPVIPAMNCEVPWISRAPPMFGAFLGIRDRARVLVGARCDARSPAGGGGTLPAGTRTGSGSGPSSAGAEPLAPPSAVPCCHSVNFACDETAYVLQVDLDRDPRWASARLDVRVVAWDELPTIAARGGGEAFDGAALEAAARGANVLVVDLDPEKTPGARRRDAPPRVENLTPDQKRRVDAVFAACERADCRAPRRPFPSDEEPCRVPNGR